MKKKAKLVDGFIPRRIGGQLGELHKDNVIKDSDSMHRPLHTGSEDGQNLGTINSGLTSDKSDIDESLKEIDESTTGSKKNKRSLKDFLKKPPKKPGRVKKFFKWLFILVLVGGLALGIYMGSRFFLAQGNVFEGSIFDIIQNQPLKQDANGRSNFLILGTSEDDPGHGGAYLTDSMMIVSVDQNKEDIFMFSIPRDLYVQYGMACNSGYSGKINEYFLCIDDDFYNEEAEKKRLTKTQEFVGDIFGLDIQYGVHVNNTVIKDAVNAVGGIDVDIQGSNGASGILDRNFDWRCSYQCYYVKYDNGIHLLDGEHALFLAMARGDVAPTYGLGNSNFDREKNQQKILIALKDKATTTGTLTNISKVTGLIDALGKNLRTNIAVKEIRTLINLAANTDVANINTVSLVDGLDSVVRSGAYNGASVVMPSAGIFNYTGIRKYIETKISNDPIVLEDANISIFNGSGVVGAAQIESDKLALQNLNVTDIGNAPKGTYETYELYAINSKPATLSALESFYGITAKEGLPSFSVASEVDIVIVVGGTSE